MTDEVRHRRRESDRAQERVQRALDRDDRAAYTMAMTQLEQALRRRAEWDTRESGRT